MSAINIMISDLKKLSAEIENLKNSNQSGDNNE